MRTWTIRILGVLNLLGIAAGLWYLAAMLRMHWHRWPVSASGGHWAIFWLLLVLNLYLTAHLAYCSFRMIRKDASAVLPVFLLQTAQILCVWGNVIVFWIMLPGSMHKIVFGLWEVALSGTDLQVFSGIAPLGFLILLILMLSCYKSRFPRHKTNTTQASGAHS